MRLQFVEKYVQAVPQESGIFILWDHSHPVYIGRTAPRSDLRAEIDHALTMAMAEDLSVTHVSFELTPAPKTRAAEELRSHFERWGSLPRYNERTSYEGGVLRADGAPGFRAARR